MLNQGTSSGRSEISYTKYELLTKSKFTKYGKRKHGLQLGPKKNP
jgi:hypothetical protein